MCAIDQSHLAQESGLDVAMARVEQDFDKKGSGRSYLGKMPVSTP